MLEALKNIVGFVVQVYSQKKFNFKLKQATGRDKTPEQSIDEVLQTVAEFSHNATITENWGLYQQALLKQVTSHEQSGHTISTEFQAAITEIEGGVSNDYAMELLKPHLPKFYQEWQRTVKILEQQHSIDSHDAKYTAIHDIVTQATPDTPIPEVIDSLAAHNPDLLAAFQQYNTEVIETQTSSLEQELAQVTEHTPPDEILEIIGNYQPLVKQLLTQSAEKQINNLLTEKSTATNPYPGYTNQQKLGELVQKILAEDPKESDEKSDLTSLWSDTSGPKDLDIQRKALLRETSKNSKSPKKEILPEYVMKQVKLNFTPKVMTFSDDALIIAADKVLGEIYLFEDKKSIWTNEKITDVKALGASNNQVSLVYYASGMLGGYLLKRGPIKSIGSNEFEDVIYRSIEKHEDTLSQEITSITMSPCGKKAALVLNNEYLQQFEFGHGITRTGSFSNKDLQVINFRDDRLYASKGGNINCLRDNHVVQTDMKTANADFIHIGEIRYFSEGKQTAIFDGVIQKLDYPIFAAQGETTIGKKKGKILYNKGHIVQEIGKERRPVIAISPCEDYIALAENGTVRIIDTNYFE